MRKKRYLKNNIVLFLYYINCYIVLFNMMLLAELNTCYKVYIISFIIVYINNRIIKKYSRKDIKKELIIF